MKRWWRDEEMKEEITLFFLRKNQIATRWWWKKSKRFPSAKSAKSSLRRRREPLEREPRGAPSHRCRHCPSHHRCPSRVHRPMATVRNCRVARWVPTNHQQITNIDNNYTGIPFFVFFRMLVIVSRIPFFGFHQDVQFLSPALHQRPHRLWHPRGRWSRNYDRLCDRLCDQRSQHLHVSWF